MAELCAGRVTECGTLPYVALGQHSTTVNNRSFGFALDRKGDVAFLAYGGSERLEVERLDPPFPSLSSTDLERLAVCAFEGHLLVFSPSLASQFTILNPGTLSSVGLAAQLPEGSFSSTVSMCQVERGAPPRLSLGEDLSAQLAPSTPRSEPVVFLLTDRNRAFLYRPLRTLLPQGQAKDPLPPGAIQEVAAPPTFLVRARIVSLPDAPGRCFVFGEPGAGGYFVGYIYDLAGGWVKVTSNLFYPTGIRAAAPLLQRFILLAGKASTSSPSESAGAVSAAAAAANNAASSVLQAEPAVPPSTVQAVSSAISAACRPAPDIPQAPDFALSILDVTTCSLTPVRLDRKAEDGLLMGSGMQAAVLLALERPGDIPTQPIDSAGSSIFIFGGTSSAHMPVPVLRMSYADFGAGIADFVIKKSFSDRLLVREGQTPDRTYVTAPVAAPGVLPVIKRRNSKTSHTEREEAEKRMAAAMAAAVALPGPEAVPGEPAAPGLNELVRGLQNHKEAEPVAPVAPAVPVAPAAVDPLPQPKDLPAAGPQTVSQALQGFRQEQFEAEQA